ncbi:hypothetical protein OSTOST_19096 [Ostertagia ostertagi]
MERRLLILLMVPVTMIPALRVEIPTKCEFGGKEYDFNTKFIEGEEKTFGGIHYECRQSGNNEVQLLVNTKKSKSARRLLVKTKE